GDTQLRRSTRSRCMYPQRAMGPPKPNVPSRRKYARSWPTEYDGSTVRFSASTTLRIGALYHTRKREQIRPRLTTAGWANCVVTASPDLQAQDLLKIVDAQRALAYGPAAHAAGRLEALHRS